MQNSARWVLPLESMSRCRSARSITQGGSGRHSPGDPAPEFLERGFDLGTESPIRASVDAWGLRGRADEDAREQEGQAGVVVPVADEAAQQVGTSQEGRIGVAPPMTKWLPPPVPVWRPSSMNFGRQP